MCTRNEIPPEEKLRLREEGVWLANQRQGQWGSGAVEGNGAIPSPVDLPDPGIKLGSPALQADSLPTELSGKPQIRYIYKMLG